MMSGTSLERERRLQAEVKSRSEAGEWGRAVGAARQLLALYEQLAEQALLTMADASQWQSLQQDWEAVCRRLEAQMQRTGQTDAGARQALDLGEGGPMESTGDRLLRTATVLGIATPGNGDGSPPQEGPSNAQPGTAPAPPRRAPRAVKSAGNEDESSAQSWIMPESPGVRFDDIIGLDDLKERISRYLQKVNNPEEVARWKHARKGDRLILFGPPGTGKTMFAKAIATEIDAVFLEVTGSNLLSKWVGESQKSVARLFETMRQHDRVVVFMDEVEGLLSSRGSNSTVRDGVVSEFLMKMDGVRGDNSAHLFVGATNRPQDLDPAVVSRFGAIFYVPNPDHAARLALLRREFEHFPYGYADDIDLGHLADRMEGHSMRAIDALARSLNDIGIDASVQAGPGQGHAITMADIEKAWRDLPPPLPDREAKRYAQLAKELL